MLRYNFETGAAIDSPFKYPGEPSSTNFFVPTAMIVVQPQGLDATEENTWIVVTGYSSSVGYGNTDYFTVCFTGALSQRWSRAYSRPGAISDAHDVDEYAVAVDHALGMNYLVSPAVPTDVVGITGSTWNGSNWDIQTVFYDMINDFPLGVVTEDSSTDDVACGLRMFGNNVGTYPNALTYVVGTRGTGAGNTIAGFRYRGGATAGTWSRVERTLTVEGATIRANAMKGESHTASSTDACYAAGQIAASGQTHMLLAKFDFNESPPPTATPTLGPGGYFTSFSYNTGGTRAGEALCIDEVRDESYGILIAIGGYSYRGSSYGNDSVVALYHEDSGAPVLRWTAWTKASAGTAYNVPDACTALAIAGRRTSPGVASLNDFYVHCAAQFPTSTSDMDLRAIVFRSTISGTPTDPGAKSSSGDPVDISGTASGGDIPRHMEANPVVETLEPTKHDFIVVGDLWNGSTNGFDILTRRFNFEEP